MYRRATVGLAAGAGTIWILTALVAGVLLLWERDAALERGVRNTEALGIVLEEETLRMLEVINVTLDGIAEAVRSAPRRAKHDADFHATLLRRLEPLRPYARAIYVIDVRGRILHNTNYPRSPDVNLADRPYFAQYLRDPRLVRSISEPLFSRTPGLGWFFAVTRRVVGEDGAFLGVAVASIEPSYFQSLYERLQLSAPDIIALYHRNGMLIARHPGDPQAVGSSFAGSAVFAVHLPRREAGSYITASGVFTYERIVSYRALKGAPLVIALSQSTQSVLNLWRRTVLGTLIALGGLLVLLSLLVVQFHRQQAANERARQRRAQAERLEALGHLAGGVAHDFGNLLNIILANLHLLAQQPADAERNARAAEIARRAVARGTDLIGRLATIGRRRPLQLVESDLNLRVKDALPLLRQAAGSRVEIALELASAPLPCRIDETELEVALVNLVVNARDAMASKGRIVVATAEDRERVCVAVSDTGCGMPEEVRRRALEPYYTTKGDAGTGLGLAQVYAFVGQLGGDVRIRSSPGEGTTVELLFPRAGRS